MAGIWDILVPAAGTNLITNPSFEIGTTGWAAASGGTLTRVAGGNQGIWHAELVSDSDAPAMFFDGVALTSGSSYVGSAYIQTTPAVTVTIQFSDSSGTLAGGQATLTGSTDWQRITTSAYSATTSADFRLYISVADTTATLLVDNAQVEAGTVATTYIDGDQPGCYWNGTKHASTSTRKATERSGGTWTDLIDLGVHVTGTFGLGEPDHQVSIAEYSLRDGGEVRNVRTPSSNFTLNVSIDGTSLSDLHTKRQTFSNYLRPNRYGKKNSSPVYLRYRGGAKNVIIKAYQEGGLSFSRSGGDGFTENAGIRFIREDEVLDTEVAGSAILTRWTYLLSAVERNIAEYNGNSWSIPVGGLDNDVNSCLYDQNFQIFAGGAFHNADSASVAVGHIAKCDGGTWTNLGAAGVNDDVYSLVSDGTGNVYFGGVFTASGDGSPIELRRVAKYNGDTLSALGAGFTDGLVASLHLSDTGDLYAAGSFTADSDGKELRRVAKLAAGADTWGALGAGFSDGTVSAIITDANGNVYAGGSFTADSDGGAFVESFAKFTAGGDTWVAVSGLNDTSLVASPTVTALARGGDGSIFVGGTFKTSTHSYFAKYNGTSIVSPASTYPGGLVYGMSYDSSTGLLYMASADGYIYAFNGRDCLRLGFANSNQLNSIHTKNGRILVGGRMDSQILIPGVVVVTNNGSGNTAPKLSIVGDNSLASNLYYLENLTTGETVYLNIALLPNEIVTIDFRDQSVVSNIEKNHYSGILSGSDFGSFHLVPGNNSIATYAVDTSYLVLSWKITEVGL